MQDKTLRTIGASVILLGIVVAAIAQAGSDDGQTPAELAVVNTSSTAAARAIVSSGHPSTTAAPELFAYRIGVLAGVTTDNFWAYFGEEPSVWNSYILGPTKPALFTDRKSVV